MSSPDWLLLIHQVPPQPGYLRAKILRRLSQIGAQPLKRAAYYLPATDTATEDLHWLRGEIVAAGGEAWIVGARFLAGLTAEEARGAFRAARANDYAALASDARALLDGARKDGADLIHTSSELRRLEKRFAEIRRIDFFDASGRTELEVLMKSIERAITPASEGPAGPGSLDSFIGRTWMTRPGVRVDRIASAWLIRRFIDPAATFVFSAEQPPGRDVIRFDTYEGEFTHDGDQCTFEVLLRRAGRTSDRGLAALAEMVHDLDLKEDRYQRVETAGLAAMLDGVIARHADDLQRIAEGAVVFDSMYEHFKKSGGA